MEKSYSAVQTATTAHCQSVERTDEELLAEALEEIFPEADQLYSGPGAFTVSVFVKRMGFGRETVRRRLSKLVEDDVMVVVLTRPRDSVNRRRAPTPAYVMRGIYDNWIAEQGGEREEDNA